MDAHSDPSSRIDPPLLALTRHEHSHLGDDLSMENLHDAAC